VYYAILTGAIDSTAPEEEIATALRSAGDVEDVRFEELAPVGPSQSRQIRIELRRLDALMKQVGELVVAKNQLAVLVGRASDHGLDELSDRVSRLVTAMQEEVLAARMSPVGEVFERFPRLVRDLARDLGKRIRFDLEGEEIELDRSILDEIGEPLLHLVRNAADHGIEPPARRLAAGKPPEGRILLSASRERNSVALRVSDDGRGIDRQAILAKAQREGLADAGTDTLTDDLLLRVLARPGFSTAETVSGVSGRGVGVDVATTRVRQLGGTLEVRSELGKGTTFAIRVPLTLAIVRALLADVGGERYAVPLAYVAETVDFDARAVTAIRHREALVVRDQVIPTVHLRSLVARNGAPGPARRPTVILEIGDRRTALVVDALVGQEDIVVAPFEAPRGMPSFVGGATILADGAPALILDAAALL
jgi:two-component system chemotaxis sensor kinase CheA